MSCRKTVFIIAAVCVIGHAPVSGQALAAGRQSTITSGQDLADGYGWRVALGRSVKGLQLSMERVEGTRADERGFCAGLILPGPSCEVEMAETHSIVRHYKIGYRMPLGTRAELAAIPAVGISYVRSQTTSFAGDREFKGSAGSLLGTLGLEATRRYYKNRIGVSIGAEMGFTSGKVSECRDCRIFSYDDGYRFGSAYLTGSLILK